MWKNSAIAIYFLMNVIYPISSFWIKSNAFIWPTVNEIRKAPACDNPAQKVTFYCTLNIEMVCLRCATERDELNRISFENFSDSADTNVGARAHPFPVAYSDL